MPKILCLSCNTGGGHNAAGRAIQETFEKNGVTCTFQDILALAGRKISGRVEQTYLSSTRIPKVFGLLYKAGDIISNNRYKSPVYWANRIYRDRVYNYIMENNFDAVVMPHLFPAETITSLKREGRLSIPAIAVATDYTCIPFWEETECDYYVIPHPDLIEEFAGKGIPKEKLLPYGIPVRPDFCMKRDPLEAKLALGLEQDRPFYLVMSGSMGFGNLEALVEAVLQREGKQVNLAVICGTNRPLASVLKERFGGHSNVRIEGYTTEIPLYMAACDVIFTKSGGLTSTEAAVRGCALIHTSPIPGCETKNALFFREKGMSFYSEETEEQAEYAHRLCWEPQLREAMCKAQRENVFPDAAQRVCDLVIRMCERKESVN